VVIVFYISPIFIESASLISGSSSSPSNTSILSCASLLGSVSAQPCFMSSHSCSSKDATRSGSSACPRRIQTAASCLFSSSHRGHSTISGSRSCSSGSYSRASDHRRYRYNVHSEGHGALARPNFAPTQTIHTVGLRSFWCQDMTLGSGGSGVDSRACRFRPVPSLPRGPCHEGSASRVSYPT